VYKGTIRNRANVKLSTPNLQLVKPKAPLNVQADHLMARFDERLGEMRSRKPHGAGDENSHREFPA
jgi:hypothetical protein